MNYTPRVVIYDHRQPNTHEPVVKDVFADEFWDQSGYAPGQRVNLERLELSKDDILDPDALPGKIASRARAIMLTYEPLFEDHPATHWIHKPHPLEQAKLDVVRQKYLDQKAELEKFDDTGTPGTAHNEQLTAVNDMIEQFSTYGAGYMETGVDSENNAEFLSWVLAAPGVPGDWQGAFLLLEDRGVCFRFNRDEPLPEQGPFDFTLSLTNGPTRYDLTFSRGNVQWSHYRNMKPAQRAKLLADLRAVLDQGELTDADNKQIKDWGDEIDQINKDQKKAGVQKKNYPPTVRAQIAALKKKIKDRKADKSGLASGLVIAKNALENQLYFGDPEKVTIQENASQFIGDDVDVTITFDRRGFIAVRVNDAIFIYENKEITATRQYHYMLPGHSFPVVRSDGGAWPAQLRSQGDSAHATLPVEIRSGAR